MSAPPFEGLWIVVLEAPPRGRELEVAGALRHLGARALESRGDHVVARFPAMDRAAPERLVARITAVGGVPVGAPRWQAYAEWRRERFAEAGGPRRIGRRFVVVPEHDAWPPQHRSLLAPSDENVVPLRIVPGLAFGSADHPTTAACLTLLEDRAVAGARVLDVGAGTGVLAIAAAALGAGRVVAVEADPFAAHEAAENVRRNDVEDRVEVVARRLVAGTPPPGAPFDGVLANLEGEHLVPLLPILGGALHPGGWIVLAGLLVAERTRALAALAEAGVDQVLEERTRGGWWSAALARAPAPRAP